MNSILIRGRAGRRRLDYFLGVLLGRHTMWHFFQAAGLSQAEGETEQSETANPMHESSSCGGWARDSGDIIPLQAFFAALSHRRIVKTFCGERRRLLQNCFGNLSCKKSAYEMFCHRCHRVHMPRIWCERTPGAQAPGQGAGAPWSGRRALDGLELETAQGDLGDPVLLRREMDGCEWCFHCAASYHLWLPDYKPMYAANVEGAFNVIDAAGHAGCQRSSTPAPSGASACQKRSTAK